MNLDEAGSDEGRQSLAQQLAQKLGRRSARMVRGRELNPAAIDPESGPVSPLRVADAMDALAAACGKPVPKGHLTAAVPVTDGDIDPRYVPFALARASLDSRWQTCAVHRLGVHDVPALAQLNAGGCLIVLSVDRDNDRARIIDARGERDLPLDLLGELTTGDILFCGHVDPENGMSEDRERSLIERNPKLWLVGVFLGEKKQLAKLLVAATMLNLGALVIPLYMRAIYDRVVPNLAIESLWALSAGVVVALMFEFLFKHTRSAFLDGIGVRVGQAVQHRAMSSILRARMNHSDNSVGTLMTGLRDVEQLALLVPQAVVAFCIDMPWFVLFLLMIAMIGGWTVTAPIVAGLAILVVGVIANFALKLASKRASRLMQARNDLIVEVTEGWTTIKANQAEGRFLKRWDVLSDHIGIGAKDVRKWNEIPGAASGFLVQMVTVAIVIIGVFQIKAGVMTSGALVAVTILAGRAMVPVSQGISVAARLYQSLSQFSGLARILRMEAERSVSDPAIRPGRISAALRLKDVTHRFEGASEPSLRGVTLTIEPGEKIALIGKSGSGKSTLLRLLAGMIPHQEGALTVDGHAIAQYAPSQLRQSIVYAEQDASIFDTSIWDNILLGMPEPDPALVDRAVRSAGLDTFVNRTAEGYARRVGPRGVFLSGGQRQSLVLARALVRDPAVLLLDEPTAAMDIQSEQHVINGLRTALDGRTLVVATHRMALLDLVERVVWLEEGRVVADKPRTEVLAMLRQANSARANGEAA